MYSLVQLVDGNEHEVGQSRNPPFLAGSTMGQGNVPDKDLLPRQSSHLCTNDNLRIALTYTRPDTHISAVEVTVVVHQPGKSSLIQRTAVVDYHPA